MGELVCVCVGGGGSARVHVCMGKCVRVRERESVLHIFLPLSVLHCD